MAQILGHSTNLNKFKGIQVIRITSYAYKEIKLETKKKKVPGKSLNIWKLNTRLVNYQWIKEKKFKKKSEIILSCIFQKPHPRCLGTCEADRLLRRLTEVNSYLRKEEMPLINELRFHCKTLGKKVNPK